MRVRITIKLCKMENRNKNKMENRNKNKMENRNINEKEILK